ncbi:MAG: hypothetical protein A3J48_03335 [Candidatus Doudnabacteria bacterium RIFCSPHIGHO2_02_FULL_46_11]|uniref:Uncharacterized protein n=1 Tax=Candidatus Doudnabacteria bacterium RIFCSPHIGHO2_02_FULL_46_11 TaxID=1817832 RepID=A0A1F5P7X4_9BACT|nr:MAG: hypothetical protein A3J48_03335 [Candidatus Doudnabacteria bacterium RIFCSPHIGHO2_02_FULL_46_11]
MNRFEGIDFIHPEAEVQPLYGQGRFAEVASLKLPENLKGKYNFGWIVKVYREPYLESGEADAAEAVKSLKNRREFLKYYFQELPNFVVDSQYVMGGSADSPTIYEFQEEISPRLSFDQGLSLNDICVAQLFNDLNEQQQEAAQVRNQRFSKAWANFDRNRRLNLRRQLTTLVELLNEMPNWRPVQEGSEQFREFEHHVIDLHGLDNILVDQQGNLRLVDTNFLFDLENPTRLMNDKASLENYQLDIDMVKFALRKVISELDKIE